MLTGVLSDDCQFGKIFWLFVSKLYKGSWYEYIKSDKTKSCESVDITMM